MILCLISLFLCAISIDYIPHNYVIRQAMPHAIPQTHSSFYRVKLVIRAENTGCSRRLS